MGTAFLAQATTGDHALIHEAPWEWVLVFGILAAYTAFELWSGRKVAEPSPFRAFLRWGLSFIVAAVFGAFVFLRHGADAVQEYTAGFFVEYGLSVDNIAVWGQVLAAFVFFRGYHRRLLMFGVLVSIALRIVFIFAGTAAVERFAITTILMAIFLIFTAKKLVAESDDEEFKVEEHRAYKIITSLIPYTPERYGTAFVTRQAGGRLGFKFTPLGIGFLIFGFVDILFAVDSVPAILSIAHDRYIIVSSNMMALLGLMSLYFLFDSVKNYISKLNEGLAIILAFVGIKMLIESKLFWDLMWNGYHVSWVVVGAIAGVLFAVWLYNRLRTRTWAAPKFALYSTAGLVALKLYAGFEPFTALRHQLWGAHPIEIPVLWSLLFILAVLAGAFFWGKFFPEEDRDAATATWQLDHTGKVVHLRPLEEKAQLAA